MRRSGLYVVALIAGITLSLAGSAVGQPPMQHATAGTHAKSAVAYEEAPIRISMKALHATGGVPRGWKFRMPPGDPEAGRKAFVAMECFACHHVEGEQFPEESKTPKRAGPDLTGMGAHHPAEYFAESILDPDRIIIEGPGYTGADNLSTMPSYADAMTVRQLVDLVAYLKSLKGDMAAHHGHAMGARKDDSMGAEGVYSGMGMK